MFIEFFIRRPVFASVCAIIITLLGAISIPTLPVSQYPSLAPPQVIVTSMYTGASSEAVESAVTVPLEQQINGVPGMRYIQSQSGSDGTSQITVTFEIDRDIDIAAVDVQNRVQTASARLPPEVLQTGITISKNTGTFVLGLALYTDDGRYDQQFMSNYADVYLRDALKRVKGVGDVRIFGERKFAMRLWLDPMRLAARGLTASDVVRALQEQNVQVAAGQVGQPPMPGSQQYQLSVRAKGRLLDEREFNDIVLESQQDGSLVRVRDVGHAELGAESYGSFLRYNGVVAVGLGVQQIPGSNAIEVARDVEAEMARLSRTFPPGLKYEVAFDTTEAVDESLDEVVKTLVEAIILVIAVIFLFLQSWRITIIPAVTIPVSLVGAFAFVKLFGFSINTMTLFGITLATGLVVDDAIVVIENISRTMAQRHLPPRQASAEGTREVFGAVIATSLVLIAVFVPVSAFPGTTGRIYQQFALTIAFSIAISAFNSVTLSPALAALLVRPEGKKNRLFAAFERLVDSSREKYQRGLRALLHRNLLVAAAFAGCLALTIFLYRTVPGGFVPEEDQGYFIVVVQAPEGASLAYTENVVEQAEAILRKNPEVGQIFSVGGFSFAGNASNRGTMFVNLKPWRERRGDEHTVAALVDRLRMPLLGLPGAIVIPFAPPAIQGLGTVGGFQFELEDQGADTRIDDLARAAFDLIGRASASPDLSGVFTQFTADDPLLVVEVDREKAKALGVPVSEVFMALQVFMGSQYVNDFDFLNRVYRVYVQADQRFRANPRDLTQLYVRSESNEMVSLANLIKVVPSTTAQTITHFNLFRAVEINGSPAPGRSSGDALRAMEQLARDTLPAGMAFEWSGLSAEEIRAGGQTLAIFVLGLSFVFLVLAAQYESFTLPFVVMLAVPLALIGALGALLLRGLPNDVYGQVGLVMLIGLSSKNAILIVEFAHKLREHGESPIDAAVHAAGTRLRPILMTSFAFLLGIAPLLFASGAGAVGRRSIGTAVFGGMLVSTFMNLVFTPSLFVFVEAGRSRLLRRVRGGGSGGGAGAEVAPSE